jgi:N-acetylglucosamine kinase-like BadF-type ATPase
MTPRTDRLVLAYLRFIARKVNQMAIDTSKLVASAARLEADVDTLLTASDNAQVQLKTISQQLADAIAANDPAALKAVQDAIDGVAAGLDAEAAKVESDTPGTTGTTGTTGATGP